MQRGNQFAATSTRARAMISELGARFIRHGSVVMTHAFSRVVLEVFKKAVSQASQSASPVKTCVKSEFHAICKLVQKPPAVHSRWYTPDNPRLWIPASDSHDRACGGGYNNLRNLIKTRDESLDPPICLSTLNPKP